MRFDHRILFYFLQLRALLKKMPLMASVTNLGNFWKPRRKTLQGILYLNGLWEVTNPYWTRLGKIVQL